MNIRRFRVPLGGTLLAILLLVVALSASAEPPYPTWKATATNTTDTATVSLTIDRPAGVTVGDLMLAQIVYLTGTDIAIAAPDGWTPLRSDRSGSAIASAIYFKAVGDLEPDTYTWRFDRPVSANGGIVAYEGVDPAAPIVADGGASGKSGMPATPSVAVVDDSKAKLVVFFASNKPTALATPTGMTERNLLNSVGADSSSLAADEDWTGTGATGSKTVTAGEDAAWTAQFVVVRGQLAPAARTGQQNVFQMWFALAARGQPTPVSTPPTSTPTRTPTPTSTPTSTPTPTVPAPSGNDVLLLIDEDSLDNGIHYNAAGGPITPSGPNFFTAQEVNDDIAGIGQRAVLRYFAANVGRTITVRTGQTGDEGWFAPTCIPQRWLSGSSSTCIDPASPDFRTAINRFWAGSVPQDPLDKTPHVMPLRALGLNSLASRNVCAVVYDSDVSINYDHGDPSLGVNGNLKGETLGTVAFYVNSTSTLNGFSSSTLPQVTITITGVGGCGQWLLFNAPVPESSSVPNDRIAPGSSSGYRRIKQWPALPTFFP
jgi:hypothetical protein